MKPRILTLFSLLALSISLPLAAQPLQNALFTAATSATDHEGDEWAFLLFQLTTTPEDLFSRRLTVYARSGGPDDPGTFTRTGNVGLQTSPAVIKVFLQRAAALGETPGDLDFALNELFGDLVPDPTIPVEEKLSAVIRGSLDDPREFANLMLLARMHPGVSLALGLAHAQRIGPGLTTFEVRELGPLDIEQGVVARVAVEAGNPIVLSAPYAPVNVPETSAMGHLNARLRWGVSDDLRRLALLQYGYNVYRVHRDTAEAFGWDDTPPPPGVLASLAPTEAEINRVNRAPVLPTLLFNEIEALDLEADPENFFIADDNGLVEDNAVPFNDGDRFYYFLAARDILGRDGETSPGTLVVIHDRVPPDAPRMPDVTNDVSYEGGVEDVRLLITWRQSPPQPKQVIVGYYVYRWNTPGDVQKYAINPHTNRISGFIPHIPGETHNSFRDDGIGAPSLEENPDQTFWYTVRAVKQTVLPPHLSPLSPNSAPAFGVLRNRDAPEGPNGQIFITCCLPEVAADRVEDVPSSTASANDPLRFVLDLIATRSSSSIAWAEFAAMDERDPELFIGRYNFTGFRKNVRARVIRSRAMVDSTIRIYCRVGDAQGNVSEWVPLEERDLPQVGFVRQYRFLAFESCEEVLLDPLDLSGHCKVHSPGGFPIPDLPFNTPPEDGGKPSNPIKLKFELTDRAEEYRIYRRVDQGDLTLWRQGLADEAEANEIVQSDGALPPNAGEVAYFGQLLDDNGNASELKLLGTHVAVAQPAPTPLLGPPEIDFEAADTRMKIRWFCPPEGVERFHVILGTPVGFPPFKIGDDLSDNQEAPQNKIALNPQENPDTDPNAINAGIYWTPAVGAGFGPGPDYEVSIPVQPGREYYVQIRAVAKNGGEKRYSLAYQFVYPSEDADALSGPDVPWPARPMPTPSPAFDTGIVPIRVTAPDFNGLGVVIGQVPGSAVTQDGHLVDPNDDIRRYLFPQELSSEEELMPIMLYRYQVASEAFPTPGGDLLQVTPLMQSIATHATAAAREIRDPFIKLYRAGSAPDPSLPYNVVLLDYQPAIRTASYAYVLVRFLPNGEIVSVHPIPSIHVAF
ncbi:MAG: hypothetical protein JJT96_19175 [Opitutales bacterium]|nr:hypothetical protein [Opitutales bacterium]